MRAVVMHEPGNVTVEELTDGLGADGVVEAVGNEASFDQALGCVRPGGHLSFVGVPHGVSLDMDRMFFAEVHTFGGPAAVRKYLPTMIDLRSTRALSSIWFCLLSGQPRATLPWMNVARRRSC